MSSQAVDQQSVLHLKGVGPKIALKLESLGIKTFQDVLFHLPFRYEDRTHVVPLGALHHGQQAQVEAVVDFSETAFGRARGKSSRRMLLCHVSDGTGALLLRFFHFNSRQQDMLKAGTRLRCYGEARRGAKSLEMMHPEYTVIDDDTPCDHDALTPVYPSTDGLHQTLLRRVSEQVIQSLEHDGFITEFLPEKIITQHRLPGLKTALKLVHRPPPDTNVEQLLSGWHPAQQRLAFEELLAQHLSLQKIRQRVRTHRAWPIKNSTSMHSKFYENLSFDLTMAQKKVIQEISSDMTGESPMLRLVQGDVGSGKTVVAAVACLGVIEAGMQVVVMAPTELLTEQHFNSFTDWFNPLSVQVTLLTGQTRGRDREQVLYQIKSGETSIIVGTQALFQKDVEFHRLALVVIDEQHRFGVHQRLAMRDKGSSQGCVPHQLIMTATPIPRSLAMTAYADLDYSVIDELPPGRKPVQTAVMSDKRRSEVVQRVEQACANGQQAYWVCTLIEESDVLQCQAAENTAALLQETFAGLSVDLVHGRMKSKDKENVMSRFKAGDIDLLVATTVIEVGVDVPNASLMIIENAERLGLAQLHQLRGRVGRGSAVSHCVLLYHPPLSEQGTLRLGVLRESNDGFVIARHDLEIRGPGEVLGTRQSGIMNLRIADIIRDEHMLPLVKQVSEQIVRDYPQYIDPIIHRWLSNAQHYASV